MTGPTVAVASEQALAPAAGTGETVLAKEAGGVQAGARAAAEAAVADAVGDAVQGGTGDLHAVVPVEVLAATAAEVEVEVAATVVVVNVARRIHNSQ